MMESSGFAVEAALMRAIGLFSDYSFCILLYVYVYSQQHSACHKQPNGICTIFTVSSYVCM